MLSARIAALPRGAAWMSVDAFLDGLFIPANVNFVRLIQAFVKLLEAVSWRAVRNTEDW